MANFCCHAILKTHLFRTTCGFHCRFDMRIRFDYVMGGNVAKTVEAMKTDLATVRKWLV